MQHSKGLLKAILITGLLAGTLDALAAIINYLIQSGKNPIRIFYFIASGVFGQEAYNGGIGMAALGLVFHYFIATCFTAFYFLIYPHIEWLKRHSILGGFIYGILVWVVMNRIVLPLSNTVKGPFNITQAIIGMAILMIAVGLIISVRASKYYDEHNRAH